jgi:hypothetical protein
MMTNELALMIMHNFSQFGLLLAGGSAADGHRRR